MLNRKKWEIIQKSNPDSLDGIVKQLLKNRGLKTKKLQQEFLNPKDPTKYSLRELKIKSAEIKKALSRLEKAKKEKQKIIIFGDYDADGITATAILWECLYKLGFDVMPFIPSRFEDGYGINKQTLKKIISENKELKLVITVDNGIVAHEAIDFANKKNIDVIITDHHKSQKKVPKAKAIIHTTTTSGSAIAWIFAREIEKKFSKNSSLINKSLELAAIGTVADQLPLIGFNRSLVKFGLSKLQKTKRVGLSKLFSISEINQDNLGTYHINFGIAPRINASGRIASGMDGLRLLCTTDIHRAAKLASNLNKLNLERQDLVKKLVGVADEQVSEDKIIVVSSDKFHEGVIGLIASRLVEKYYRPVIAVSLDKKSGKASARSIKGFSIVDAINQFRELIIEGGGHDMAAGFSIQKAKLGKFVREINKYFEKQLNSDILSPSLEIESKIDFSLLNQNLYHSLHKFEPFGIGNKRPVFMTERCEIIELKTVGSDNSHLKLRLKKNNKQFDAIFFRAGDLDGKLKLNECIDVAYQVDENEWNGRKKLQLIVKDVRRSDNESI